MKKIVSFIKKYFYIIESFVISISLVINLSKNTHFVYSFNRGTVVFLIIFALISFFYYKTNSIKSKVAKKGKIISFILSQIFALIDVVGLTYEKYQESILDNYYLVNASIRFLGMYFLSYRFINILLHINVEDLFSKFVSDKRKEASLDECVSLKRNSLKDIIYRKYYFSKRFRILFIGFIILALYMPYFLNYFPGIMQYDGQWQMAYVDHLMEFQNHHPVFHTMFIALFMKIANFLNGDNNMAVALYCYFQMVACSFTFSYIIEFMRSIKTSKIIRIITFLLFAFVPTYPLFAVTLWKDTSYGLAFPIFTIYLIKLIIDKEKFFYKKRDVFIFICSIIFVALLKNNGIYVITLSFPFILLALKKHYKFVLLTFGVSFVFCFGWNFFIHNILHVVPTEIKEMMDIPAQAFTRVYKYNKKELTDVEKEQIHKFVPKKDLDKVYKPDISDPVRFSMNDDIIKKNFGELVSLYFKLLYKFPKTVIDAFINGCYGYFYPNYDYWRVQTELDVTTNSWSEQMFFAEKLGLKENPIIHLDIIDKIGNFTNDGEVLPFFNIFVSIGLWFEVTLFLIGYNIYYNNSKRIIVFIPYLFLVLTCVASPVNGCFRYVYPIFTTMPLYLGATLYERKRN